MLRCCAILIHWRRSVNPLFRNVLIGVLLGALLSGCNVNPEMNALSVPQDQAEFQAAWNKGLSRYSYDPKPLQKIPKTVTKWTGKVLLRNTVGGTIELYVVQIADKVAFIGYGVDPKIRADRGDRDNYIEFSGTLPDNPRVPYHSDELRLTGIWQLVEFRFEHVEVPGKAGQRGWN
jgi:hypothetical protein